MELLEQCKQLSFLNPFSTLPSSSLFDLLVSILIISLAIIAYVVLCGYANMDHVQIEYHGRFQYPTFHPDYKERESKQAKSSSFNSLKSIDPFSWLETPSPDRSVWLEQQRLCTENYCRSLKSTCEKF